MNTLRARALLAHMRTMRRQATQSPCENILRAVATLPEARQFTRVSNSRTELLCMYLEIDHSTAQDLLALYLWPKVYQRDYALAHTPREEHDVTCAHFENFIQENGQ